MTGRVSAASAATECAHLHRFPLGSAASVSAWERCADAFISTALISQRLDSPTSHYLVGTP